MKIATDWKDYKIIATGNGEKLEKWGNVCLLRPDPQVIWKAKFDFSSYPALSARYLPEGKLGEKWELIKNVPETFRVSRKNLTFNLKLMKGFKHTGLFPEQAVNWEIMRQLIGDKQVSVLNLFGYTGAATVACAKQGAFVTHVDSAKNMVERAKQNLELSGLRDKPVRFIVDDCKKFIQREIKRGHFYDAIIMDPPSYGRGPTGEMWKIESDLFDLVELCKSVLSKNPLFFLINSYTTGLQPTVMQNIISRALDVPYDKIEAYEVGLPTDEKIVLPCGCSAMFVNKK